MEKIKMLFSRDESCAFNFIVIYYQQKNEEEEEKKNQNQKFLYCYVKSKCKILFFSLWLFCSFILELSRIYIAHVFIKAFPDGIIQNYCLVMSYVIYYYFYYLIQLITNS